MAKTMSQNQKRRIVMDNDLNGQGPADPNTIPLTTDESVEVKSRHDYLTRLKDGIADCAEQIADLQAQLAARIAERRQGIQALNQRINEIATAHGIDLADQNIRYSIDPAMAKLAFKRTPPLTSSATQIQ